jgi:hypothetical protein
MKRSIVGSRPILARLRVFLLVLPLIPWGCARPAGSERLVALGQPRSSPSGEYALVLDEKSGEKFHYYAVSILDKAGGVACLCPEKFLTRHSLFLCWADDADVAWCYSGDLGIFYWSRDAAGTWRESAYKIDGGPGGVKPPIALKSLRPSFFVPGES